MADEDAAPNTGLAVTDGPASGQLVWHPDRGGRELTGFIERALESEIADPDQRHRIIDEAAGALGRCPPPGDATGAAGLVLGYVQSGKTLSFTCVTALAADNGYRLVLVITGTKTSLRDQSSDRLSEHLGISDDNRAWAHHHIERDTEIDVPAIDAVIQEWNDPDVPRDECRTVLITVLKEARNLERLRTALSNLPLQDTPVLIIDDEADQASLNTKIRQAEESSIYSLISQLRASAPRHAYLQYTATPQALLLIDLFDELSPSFVQLLTPGNGYTGGAQFFHENTPHVSTIPQGDLFENGGLDDGAPDSLLEAMRVFVVGVCDGVARGHHRRPRENRTMLVHPHQNRDPHAEYERTIRMVIADWQAVLGMSDDDPERLAVEQEFFEAYQELSQTADLVPWEQVRGVLRRSIGLTRIVRFNSDYPSNRTPAIDWSNYPSILIGGEALGRGFTVRGLTVTYMPRGLGGGQADTVQQRARFFGYKAGYMGLCRVYLEQTVLRCFESYVDSEHALHRCLRQLNDEQRPLSDLARIFLLGPGYQPTRRNVYQRDVVRRSVRGWRRFAHAHECSEGGLQINRDLLEELSVSFQFDEVQTGDGSDFRHSEAQGIAPAVILERLLMPMAAGGDDRSLLNVFRFYFSWLVDERPDEVCRLVLMSKGTPRGRTERPGGIEPHQGRSTGYAGDAAIRSPGDLTIQIHRVNVQRESGAEVSDCLFLCVHAPRRLSAHIVEQPRT